MSVVDLLPLPPGLVAQVPLPEGLWLDLSLPGQDELMPHQVWDALRQR